VIAIILIVALLTFFVAVLYLARKKRISKSEKVAENEMSVKRPANSVPIAKQPFASKLSLIEKYEITNSSGQSIVLSRIDSTAALDTKKFQEITARGSAIGANLVQGAMPAQTLAQIAKAAPDGLFTATAPLSELIKYKDGTVGSIVMKGGKMANHSGFRGVSLSVDNPAALVVAGMQAMAMISGQYYMDRISKQLDGIIHGIERLIGFHNDKNIGTLLSVQDITREIIGNTHVGEADIYVLKSGILDTGSVLNEYITRLERLSKTGELTEIEVGKLIKPSAEKKLKSLKANIEKHELFNSFQICLIASKLQLECKKAEFVTRMKMGEPEKAIEAFEAFKVY